MPDPRLAMVSVESRVLHKVQVIWEMGHQEHQGNENLLLTALEAGNLSLVQLLGARHANCVLNIRGEEMGYQTQTPARFGLAGLWTLEYTQELTSPLCITSSRGYTECVRYLLHRRADPNAAPGGRSPLHEACSGGHDDCVQLLLEHGANPNQRSDDGRVPLHFCETKSSLRCAELLLQHGALVNQTTEELQDTSLHIAARLGLLDHVELYLHGGAISAINCKNLDGETPLIAACGGNGGDGNIRLQLCQLLLEEGADPEAQDQQERRPVHHACRKADHRLVELLLAAGVDVNATDYNGVLPLSCVLQSAELYRERRPHLTVRALLNHGARCVYPEAFGMVLRYCSGVPEVISLLYSSYLSLEVCSRWRQDIPENVFQEDITAPKDKPYEDRRTCKLLTDGALVGNEPQCTAVRQYKAPTSSCSETHESFYTTFFSLSGTVRSLQHLCRFTLRKHFNSQCYHSIPLLPVPAAIKDYLLLAGEWSDSLL